MQDEDGRGQNALIGKRRIICTLDGKEIYAFAMSAYFYAVSTPLFFRASRARIFIANALPSRSVPVIDFVVTDA